MEVVEQANSIKKARLSRITMFSAINELNALTACRLQVGLLRGSSFDLGFNVKINSCFDYSLGVYGKLQLICYFCTTLNPQID
jgi:hypothetical protein